MHWESRALSIGHNKSIHMYIGHNNIINTLEGTEKIKTSGLKILP